MNCPYCDKVINGLTGLQEVKNFHKHLARCRKNPNNAVAKVGRKIIIDQKKKTTIMDALRIRAESGQ